MAQAASDVVLGEVIHAAVGHDAQGALRARPAHAQHSIVTSRSMRNVLARVKAEMLVESVPVVLENVAKSHISVEIGVVKLSKISKASLFVAPVVVHHVEEGVEPLQPVLLLGKLDPRAPVHGQGLLHDRRVHGVDVVEQDPGSGLCGVVVRKLAVVGLPIRLRDVYGGSDLRRALASPLLCRLGPCQQDVGEEVAAQSLHPVAHPAWTGGFGDAKVGAVFGHARQGGRGPSLLDREAGKCLRSPAC